MKDVGSNVTVAKPGDAVLLSFSSCQTCRICLSGQLAHCTSFNRINFTGKKCFSSSPITSSDSNAEFDIAGSFFGQSSFASLSIVSEGSVVNAKDLVRNEEELKLFAPLGCGIQTGAGTVVNVAKPTSEDTVCVIGLGGVGLSAVMGAALCGCKTIVGIDRVQSRLDIAKELGCSHVIDTSNLKDLGDVVEEVRKVTDGYGTSVTVDTTGLQKLIEAGVQFTSNGGQYIQVGSTMPNQKIELPIQMFMAEGKRFIGAVEGQVIPQEFVPKMISWYRDGRFPVDKLVKISKAKEFAKAIEEMHDGSTIKPVITWT